MTAPLAPGENFTFTESGISFLTDADLSGGDQISRRGQVITVTEQLRTANADRTGHSWIDLANDPDAQRARWGKVLMVAGEVTMSPWQPNTVEADIAREARRLAAHAEPDDARRAEKLRQLAEEFGPVHNPSGQTSSWTPGDAERDAILRSEGRK